MYPVFGVLGIWFIQIQSKLQYSGQYELSDFLECIVKQVF